MRRTLSYGSSSGYSRSFDLPEDCFERPEYGGCGAMLPVFLNDVGRNVDRHTEEMVEVTLELDERSVVMRSVVPAAATDANARSSAACGRAWDEEEAADGFLRRSYSSAARLRRMFTWRRSASARAYTPDQEERRILTPPVVSVREMMKMKAKLDRNRSSAQRALGGLRFISRNTDGKSDPNLLWKQVEARFDHLAKDGLLSRQDFGECIGMGDSKEFAVGLFDALARRRRQNVGRITKAELHEFWLQISDHSFDARLQIFFDMADSNGDGKITRDEVQELMMLSVSANKLCNLKERAEEYASLIMEELDPENLGYIELWQLETLLLQRYNYMDYSRPLSTTSVGWSQNMSKFSPQKVASKGWIALKLLLLDNWQRNWILWVWILAMAGLFTWKFLAYRQKAAFQIMGYCLTTAKGAAETLKLNMALVLLPVCRNILTWLRSTSARLFIPFDDNINFHKVIATTIAIGIIIHAGSHLTCDLPRLVRASPDEFSVIASDFAHGVQPTYGQLLSGTVGITGIIMVLLIMISFTLATRSFRKSGVKLPTPFNRLTGFNAFWYSHHLLGLVYILLLVHGSSLFLVHQWYAKTTWMYISIPLVLYIAERSLRNRRSEHYAVKILKVSVLPGGVFSLVLAKPNGFKYISGQYIFLQCPTISPFEWHPFSLTSAPGDNYLSVHIRTVGDWTQELKRVFTEEDSSATVISRDNFGAQGNVHQNGLPKLLVDGPYGAPAQHYQNYDVLLLVGLGIGATPFISILKDLLDSTRLQDQVDSNTETSRSDDSSNSIASSREPTGKKKAQHTRSAHFYWITREPDSFEWFKGVMNEGQIEMHNYLTSVYEEGDARSTLITMVQALNHAKHGVDILSGTRVRTHFARPNWKEVFKKVAAKHPCSTVGVFYCGMPILAKELKKLSQEVTRKTSTRFEFHKEYF
ncbi:respiratory burst oxidaseprotein E [Dorcoceras hygrometricum]|uniref:Respiratory burst oxidaseprotein E n=1 Tax=Dorcoceras hygrometricum TaxID=472368 RepID=A0A2Z7B5I0_9LAMI|nr:respiratory burst oxidaseprotein E [Dorcoceras hygrometricum]